MADFEKEQRILDKVFGEGMRKWKAGNRPTVYLKLVKLKAELQSDENIDDKTKMKIDKLCDLFYEVENNTAVKAYEYGQAENK